MEEFYKNQEELVFLSEQILAEKQKTTIEFKYRDDLADIQHIEGKNILRQVQTRVNQSVFRTMVLNNYHSKCCITGINIPDLLVASHIIPWSKNEKERLNPRNGLCLNALHDKAFDKGYITVTPDYQVKISYAIENYSDHSSIKKYFLKYNNEKIIIPEKFLPDTRFLEYHLNEVFIK